MFERNCLASKVAGLIFCSFQNNSNLTTIVYLHFSSFQRSSECIETDNLMSTVDDLYNQKNYCVLFFSIFCILRLIDRPGWERCHNFILIILKYSPS